MSEPQRFVRGAWVLGFDLSLTAPAAVALPIDWKPGDWGRAKAWLLKTKAPSSSDDEVGQLNRYAQIALWAAGVVGGCSKLGARPQVFVEAYGFRKNNASASRIMEAGGITKLEVFKRWGVTMTTVNASQARKLLLGFNPPKDPKLVVQDVLFNRAGAPKTWDENQADAFVVCQFGLAELGGKCFAYPPPPKPKKGAVKKAAAKVAAALKTDASGRRRSA